jgi:putative ABC transport system ATP-binding protein
MIELHRVSKIHGPASREVTCLREVGLRIERGEYVAIMGPSGAGKTTLLQILGGLDTPTSGSVRFLGQDFSAKSDRERTLIRRRRIGFVFQDSNLVGSLNAVENVALPLRLDGVSARRARTVAHQGLDRLGLALRAGHFPGELSGGERQRVAIARALAYDPVLVLCDEPTGSLDSSSGREVRSLLRAVPSGGARSVVLVTHDPEVASDADRIVHIKDGFVCDVRSSRGPHARTLSHA